MQPRRGRRHLAQPDPLLRAACTCRASAARTCSSLVEPSSEAKSSPSEGLPAELPSRVPASAEAAAAATSLVADEASSASRMPSHSMTAAIATDSANSTKRIGHIWQCGATRGIVRRLIDRCRGCVCVRWGVCGAACRCDLAGASCVASASDKARCAP
eukprot:253305-Chlamydomonas_euryale.AAC.2